MLSNSHLPESRVSDSHDEKRCREAYLVFTPWQLPDILVDLVTT